MIARLKGKILEKTPSAVVVAAGGIGFEVLVSGRTFRKLPENGDEVELEIYTHVREDELRLVGFTGSEEKRLFVRLLSVSGISIKIALSALTIYSFSELRRIIASRDADMVRRVPGIGKKLAERLILELKDRFDEDELMETALAGGQVSDQRMFEVRQALKTLGYSTAEINKALSRIKTEDIREKNVEEMLKAALKEV